MSVSFPPFYRVIYIAQKTDTTRAPKLEYDKDTILSAEAATKKLKEQGFEPSKTPLKAPEVSAEEYQKYLDYIAKSSKKPASRVLTKEEGEAWNNYYHNAQAAQNGFIATGFAKTNMSFMQSQAETIAAGGEYDDDNDFEQSYIWCVSSFFSDAMSKKEFMSSLQDSMTELAQRIQTGGDTDLHSLTTKFRIADTDVTLGDIMDMQSAVDLIINGISSDANGVHAGSEIHIGLSITGIKKAAAKAYGDKLGGTLGQAFTKSMNQLIDNNTKACLDLQKKMDLSYGTWVGKVAEKSHDTFSDIDFSSPQTAKQGFQVAMSRLKSSLATGANGYGGFDKKYIQSVQQDLQSAFNKAYSFLF